MDTKQVKRIALILSGGTGTRMGLDIPKQYVCVGGCMLITHTLKCFFSHSEINAVQIVAAETWREKISHEMERFLFSNRTAAGERPVLDAHLRQKFRGFSAPGETRQLSILSGLRDISAFAAENDIVIVHDAARPLVSDQLLSAGIEAMADYEGVMPVLPMKDTVYESVDGRHISKLLRREHILAGQAPEFFRFGKYMAANKALDEKTMLSINGASEPAILAGMDIGVIPGEERNFKITTPEDLVRYEEIMKKGQAV